jgi:hypothetical protein
MIIHLHTDRHADETDPHVRIARYLLGEQNRAVEKKAGYYLQPDKNAHVGEK